MKDMNLSVVTINYAEGQGVKETQESRVFIYPYKITYYVFLVVTGLKILCSALVWKKARFLNLVYYQEALKERNEKLKRIILISVSSYSSMMMLPMNSVK